MLRTIVQGLFVISFATALVAARQPAEKKTVRKIAPPPPAAVGLPTGPAASPIPELPAIVPSAGAAATRSDAKPSPDNPGLAQPAAGPSSPAGAANTPASAEAAAPETAPAAEAPAASSGELGQDLLDKLRLAGQHAKANQVNEAIALYTEVLSARKDLFSPYMDRGKLYHGLKQYAKAIEDYSAVLALKPDFADALSRRSSAYYESGAFANAVSDCDKLIKAKPRSYEPYHIKGMSQAALREYDKAIETLGLAFEINNDLTDAHLLLARIYSEQDNLLSALREYSVVLQQRPGFIEALKERAAIRQKLGDDSGAKDDLGKVASGR